MLASPPATSSQATHKSKGPMNATEDSSQQTFAELLDDNVQLLMDVYKRCPLVIKALSTTKYLLFAEPIREHASELYLRFQSAASKSENEQKETFFLVVFTLIQNQGETMKEVKSTPKPPARPRDCHNLRLMAALERKLHSSNDLAEHLNQILSNRSKAPASDLSLQFQSTDREIRNICRNDFIQNIISIQEKKASTLRPKPSLHTPKIQRKHQHANERKQHHWLEHLPDVSRQCHQNPDL